MRYQYITSRIWHDEKFLQLTPMQQRLFFYLLTCPHGNIIGLFVLKPGYACDDLKCNQKDFERDMKRLEDLRFVSYDAQTNVTFLHNFLKHNPLTNPNQLKGARKTFSELPKSLLLWTFAQLHKTLTEGLTEGLPKGLLKPESESVSESESVPDTEPEKEALIVPYAEIIKDLNLQTGKNYLSTTKDTREMIRALWKQGFRIEHFKQVHVNMAAKWKNDPEWERFLRPATLYQSKKFEGYLNTKVFLSDKGIISVKTQRSMQVFERFAKEDENAG